MVWMRHWQRRRLFLEVAARFRIALRSFVILTIKYTVPIRYLIILEQTINLKSCNDYCCI